MVPRILLVEDNDELRIELATVLRVRGYDVFEARSLRDGLARATELQPDVIVTELLLPDTRNYRFASAYRLAVRHDVTIIAVTWMPTMVFESARRVGFDEVYEKPVSIAELVEWIESRAHALLDPTG